jgi:hypothetical protein
MLYPSPSRWTPPILRRMMITLIVQVIAKALTNPLFGIVFRAILEPESV